MRGEVIFTFDGDAAGQRAALKAFEDDQRFVAGTFVAVEPNGLDPCELRQQHGDPAVVALIEARTPLFEFAIRSTLATYDLNSAEGRVAALRDAAPVVGKIRDPALRPEYGRRLAGWLGMDVETVTKAISTAARSQAPVAPPERNERPRPSGPEATVEREALKCALQQPEAVSAWYASVEDQSYLDPDYRLVHVAIAAAGGPRVELLDLAWIDAVLAECLDDSVRSHVRALAVEPLPSNAGADARYATSMVARLLEMSATRMITELRGRMQRADAETDPEVHAALFAELMAVEAYRRDLREHVHGV